MGSKITTTNKNLFFAKFAHRILRSAKPFLSLKQHVKKALQQLLKLQQHPFLTRSFKTFTGLLIYLDVFVAVLPHHRAKYD